MSDGGSLLYHQRDGARLVKGIRSDVAENKEGEYPYSPSRRYLLTWLAIANQYDQMLS